jgi:uncharacterized membrane protein
VPASPPDGAVHDLAVGARVKRRLTVVAAALAAATLLGMLLVGFGTDVRPDFDAILAKTVYEAEVRRARLAPCSGTVAADDIDCVVVELRLVQGPDQGEARTLEFTPDSRSTPDLEAGDRVVLAYAEDARPGEEYTFADRQRRRPLLGLVILFAAAVVLLGRGRGLAALAGLAASLVVILQFVLPAILEGHSPVLVAVLGSAAIAFLALYVAHGFTALTTVALLGTLGALALTVLLSALFTGLTELSGFATEEAATLGLLSERVDVRGLVLAGIVIGALGALDDMTVTQASAVAELRAVNPDIAPRDLYAASIRIGRDHVASTVNTLALAYAGAALPLLLLFVLSGQSLGTVANSEVVATEIVRTLVGSVGLVVSVPLTTWLAVLVVGGGAGQDPSPRRRRARRRDPGHDLDGGDEGARRGSDDPSERGFWS